MCIYLQTDNLKQFFTVYLGLSGRTQHAHWLLASLNQLFCKSTKFSCPPKIFAAFFPTPKSFFLSQPIKTGLRKKVLKRSILKCNEKQISQSCWIYSTFSLPYWSPHVLSPPSSICITRKQQNYFCTLSMYGVFGKSQRKRFVACVGSHLPWFVTTFVVVVRL